LLSDFKNHETLTEKVYKSLKKSILNGDLEPGQKLSQDWLAKQMKVSRMPVREAIERLKAEGLIKNIPYKESRIINITSNDIREIYSLRVLLEGYSARLATRKIGEDDLKKLKILNKEMKEYLDKKKYKQLHILNKSFHLIIHNKSGNKRLYKMIINLWDSLPKKYFWKFPERAESSISEHEKIINIIEKRDERMTERIIIQHIQNTESRIIKIFSSLKRSPLL